MRIRYINLDGTEYADVACYQALLPPQRQEKIDRMRFDSDKLLSLVAGLMIRFETKDAPLFVTEHGKPCVVGGDIHFSVSHSAKCVAIAVGGEEVGLDVERLPQKDFLKIAERFFHPDELQYVRSSQDQKRAFTRVWTRKEAYLKQQGIGVAADLSSFDTVSAPLSERIVSFDLDDYVLSACGRKTVEESINISKLELKDII